VARTVPKHGWKPRAGPRRAWTLCAAEARHPSPRRSRAVHRQGRRLLEHPHTMWPARARAHVYRSLTPRPPSLSRGAPWAPRWRCSPRIRDTPLVRVMPPSSDAAPRVHSPSDGPCALLYPCARARRRRLRRSCPPVPVARASRSAARAVPRPAARVHNGSTQWFAARTPPASPPPRPRK
jgi:hypothetical protein